MSVSRAAWPDPDARRLVASPAQELSCPSCPAPLARPEPNARYVRCDYCGTTAIVHRTGAGRHLIYEITIDRGSLPERLRAWRVEGATAAHLHFHPFWEFAADGRTLAVDAAPRPGMDFGVLRLPAGRRAFRDAVATEGADIREPTAAPEARAEIVASRLRADVAAEEVMLVHLPIYRVVQGDDGAAWWIDAVEGTLLGDKSSGRPAKRGGRHVLTLYAAILAIFLAALLLPLPVAFAMAGGVAVWPVVRGLVRS